MNDTHVNVRILFFAKARELSGLNDITTHSTREILGKTLLDNICQKYGLEIIKNNIILAINEEYIENLGNIIQLNEGDEIAVIPPISGDKLNITDINDLVSHESCGALSFFAGTTRDNFQDKKVVTLEYEAYEPMALKSMGKICTDLRENHPDIKHIAIYHRLGTVPVKEASVIIAISSPHRQTSLKGVEFAIDSLKKSVPIWKKEIYENDDPSWKENNESATVPSLAIKSKFSKKPKLELNACEYETNSISNNFVQINAEDNELTRRMKCFLDRKREEVDINNVLDFVDKKNNNTTITIKEDPDDDHSCARVNSIVKKLNDSKGNLRVHRVKNEYGPQTQPDYNYALDKLMENKFHDYIKSEPGEKSKDEIPVGAVERLENVEKYLKVNMISSKNVYDRLKDIEDKILQLETISPEYSHFLDKKKEWPKPKKKILSVQEIDSLMDNVKERMLKKRDL